MTGSSLRHVNKRQVVHIGGFDPIDEERLNHRMVSGLGKFGRLWNVNAQPGPPDISEDGRVMSWHVAAEGPNWRTETDYVVLRWDDVIARYMARPGWRNIVNGFVAILHFMLNGTVFRYFVANGRYGMFVLYPLFLLVGFAAVAFYVGRAVAGLDFPAAAALGVLVGIAVLIALLKWVGGYFHLYFALADWSFAADLVRGRVAGMEDCLDQFAGEIVGRIRERPCDEVILSGVSFGAVMMAETLARALASDPDLCRRDARVVFMTIGSSILKIGLHPGAASLKSAVGRVASEPSLLWIEYQSKVDPINFFKTDPVAKMGLPPTGKPIVKTMRIRETMTAEEYRYLKVNFLRLHRQFAMPNSRRYFYDFYMICFGPMSLAERVALGERAAARFGEDGSYRPVRPNPDEFATAAG